MFSYTGEAAKTKTMIMERRDKIQLNTIYKHSKGFLWKENNLGYIHVFKVELVNFMGEKNFEVVEYLLTKNNMLKNCGSYGYFKTAKEADEKLKEIMEDHNNGCY